MKYYCALLLLLVPAALIAAPLKLRLDTGKVKADTDTVAARKRSISVGINYGSDIQFFGRTGPITYPYMSADAIYNTKQGFFIYASGLKVLGYNPFFDEIDLGGGYLYRLSKYFSGTASYTRFFFNRDAAQIIKSASSNDVNLKNTYDWKIAQSSVTFDYLFGKESDFFTTITTSKYYESKFGVFDKKDYLSINPSVSLILGTQNFVQKYSLDHDYPRRLEEIGISGDDPHLFSQNNGRFNMLNYSFKFPIAYNRPHYTFEFAYKYSIPVNVDGLLQNTKESFYNLTFYYLFY